MVDFNRQELGRRGGQEPQRRLRTERAQQTAAEIAAELDRRALLHNSDGGRALTAEELQPVIDVIAPLLQDVVKPASSRKPKGQADGQTTT